MLANQTTEEMLKKYLALKNPNNLNLQNNWYLSDSGYGGRGLFAKEVLELGTIIAIDHPLIQGPRASTNVIPSCIVCYSNQNPQQLRMCVRKCGLPLCSDVCENASKHTKLCAVICKWMQLVNHSGFSNWSLELLRCTSCLVGLESYPDICDLVNVLQCNQGPQHGFELKLLQQSGLEPNSEEIQIINRICGVMDTNAFEIVVKTDNNQTPYSLRGLFPLGALLNHCCTPNTMHVFNDNNQMVLKTTRRIEKGQELTTTYTNLIWGNVARRHNLYMTKHFWCHCERCSDPTEFGTNLSGLYCTKRGAGCVGVLLPKWPLKIDSKWVCDVCGEEVGTRQIGMIQSVMGSLIGVLSRNDCGEICDFVQNRLENVIPPCNQLAFDFKYRLIGMLGYAENYGWNGRFSSVLS